VDRFDQVLSVQLNTAGMEARRAEIIEALDKVVRPQAIVLRNDSAAREAEGLPAAVEVLGTLPAAVEVHENGLRYHCCPRMGQKTGWFYDQADNRRRLAPYAKDASVLDVFSYLGAWGISAGIAGAASVTCVDSSATALEGAAKNAQLNDIPLETLCGDAFEVLKTFREERRRFGVVIVDPPAFIKRRKDLSSGTSAYRRLNQLALPLVEHGGYLITGSCSQHLSAPALLEQVHAAARHVDRQIQVVETGGQSRDHPIHPAIPETAYLKMLFLRVLRN
jgi:23S rRNA (cytosine1962-C5)-methyltransferase